MFFCFGITGYCFVGVCCFLFLYYFYYERMLVFLLVCEVFEAGMNVWYQSHVGWIRGGSIILKLNLLDDLGDNGFDDVSCYVIRLDHIICFVLCFVFIWMEVMDEHIKKQKWLGIMYSNMVFRLGNKQFWVNCTDHINQYYLYNIHINISGLEYIYILNMIHR